MKKLHRWITILLAVLLAGLPLGCDQSNTAVTPWEAAGVSEDFYGVSMDFARRFLILDEDGARYDQALDAVAQYLDGTVSQEEAQTVVQEALTAIEDALASEETVALSEQLTAQLQAVGISAAEYELFANSRASQLQTQQVRLSTLDFYLTHTQEQPDMLESLRFSLTADQAEQDSLRGYYYYGNFNYWFPWASETELAHLQYTITDQLASYRPTDATWYTDLDSLEQRVMQYLDDIESVITLVSEHVGQSQAALYQMEQDYAALLEQIEENHLLQEKLAALEALSQRLDTLSAEIAAAKEAGDEVRLAELKPELEAIQAEYEMLTTGDIP